MARPKRSRGRRRLGLLALIGFGVVCGVAALVVLREQRRSVLDRTLIAAIQGGDTPAAIRALDAGADANAHVTPAPALPPWESLWNMVRGIHPRETSDTALQSISWDCRSEPIGKGREVFVTTSAVENLPLMQALLEHGARPDEPSSVMGCTPLERAVLDSHSDTVRLLLKYGAAANGSDLPFNFTPLMAASITSNAENIHMLLAKRANPNQQTRSGKTALMMASERMIPEIQQYRATLKLLLDHGADPNLRDKTGKTALDYARQNRNKVAIAVLTAAKAK